MSVPDILPPSPPTTSHRHRAPLAHLAKPTTSTPDDSPASLLPSSAENGSRKRVEFSPWTNVLEASLPDQSLEASALKALPKSRDCQSVSKSILKPQLNQADLVKGCANYNVASDGSMESLVQALGNNDKITSVDAYQCLAQVIKSYDEVSDDADTRGSVASILRSIRRDLAVQVHGQTTPVDINLVTQALKVTVILVWSEQFSPLLPDEFKVFITDRAVGVLAEHNASKVVIVHYMHVLATQSFRSAVFNSGNRVLKLLEALRDITNHVQGKGAMTERLLIYQKLIEQAKPVMKAKAGLWIKEVFCGLCSNVKEIRDKAIAVCTKVVATFPASPVVSQAARDALSEETKDRALNITLTQRLDRMIAAKDEAIQVPQIWALVMLLCNSTDMRIDNWTHIRDWLRVIQRCFNCSDINVRVQAFPAWNRFIYIIKPHEATEAMMSMLAKPIAVQIERTGANASSKGSRPAAISSYCTLLYYAFRPAASHKQYTKAWNEYVVKVATSQFLSKSTANADLCCRVLMALFWKEGSASRIWNEARALENKAMAPEELPSIDCKWIRSKAIAILDIFRLLFKYSAWGPSIQHSDQAFVAKSWRAFLRAIRESSSKEIKLSGETRTALSGVISFLNEMGRMEDKESTQPSMNLLRAQISCRIAISELGGMSMLETLELAEAFQDPATTLQELLAFAVNCLQHMKEGSEKTILPQANVQHTLSLPTLLQRTLALLDHQTIQRYHSAEISGAALSALLGLLTRTVQTIPLTYKLACLRCLETSLTLVLKDERCLHSSFPADANLAAALSKVTVAVVDCATQLGPTHFEQIDALLGALLSSNSESFTNTALKAWNSTRWNESNGRYGPLLTLAVEELQKRTMVNLPGFAALDSAQLDLSQVGHIAFAAAPDMSTQVMVDTASELTLEKDKLVVVASEVVGNPEEKDSTNANNKKRATRSSNRKRKHDDSQLKFDPVESSPTNPEELDSQELTERQKEVRNRQRSEQAVVFADLRSSPVALTARTSRATSVDCEMARKIAASENLPTTPTLAKHIAAVDDEDLPSPTPKARYRTLRIEEIEIPSSPPSITANRNVDLNPSNPVLSAGLETEGEEPFGEAVENIAGGCVNLQIAAQPIQSARSRKLRSSSRVTTNDVPERAAVPEVVMQDVDVKQPALEADGNASVCGGLSAISSIEAVVHLKTADTNESVDSESASQLSHDPNDRTLQAKGDHNDGVAGAVEAETRTRKRKRTVVDYAEMSGQQTRKRHSTGKIGHGTNDKREPGSTPESNSVDPVLADESNLPRSEEKAIGNTLTQTVMSDASNAQTPASPVAIQGVRVRPRRSKRGSSQSKSDDRTVRCDVKVRQISCADIMEQDSGTTSTFDTAVTKQTVHNESEQTNMTDSTDITRDIKIVPNEHTDIMKALGMALEGLEHSGMAQQIDLKALDDLCFKIRYKAQEIVQKRDSSS